MLDFFFEIKNDENIGAYIGYFEFRNLIPLIGDSLHALFDNFCTDFI